MEKWKDILGYEGRYSVSNKGNVRSNDVKITVNCKDGRVMNKVLKGKMLSKFDNKSKKFGYVSHRVALSVAGKTRWRSIHQLVAETFIDNPNNYSEINHKDGNPINNNVENLEWIDRRGNIIHAMNNGLMNFEKPVVQFDEHGEIYRIYRNEKLACNHHGVKSNGKVARAIRLNRKFHGYNWGWFDGNYREGDKSSL